MVKDAWVQKHGSCPNFHLVSKIFYSLHKPRPQIDTTIKIIENGKDSCTTENTIVLYAYEKMHTL